MFVKDRRRRNGEPRVVVDAAALRAVSDAALAGTEDLLRFLTVAGKRADTVRYAAAADAVAAMRRHLRDSPDAPTMELGLACVRALVASVAEVQASLRHGAGELAELLADLRRRWPDLVSLERTDDAARHLLAATTCVSA
jgi:hypothetical protein